VGLCELVELFGRGGDDAWNGEWGWVVEGNGFGFEYVCGSVFSAYDAGMGEPMVCGEWEDVAIVWARLEGHGEFGRWAAGVAEPGEMGRAIFSGESN